jgi:hypothetical protein
MTNAITTPTIDSVISTIQLSENFHVSDLGMQITGHPTIDEFMHMAYLLGRVRGALSWAVGDYMNSFEAHHGEAVAQAEVMFPEKSYQYLMDCKWVSKKVVMERRNKASWSAWKEVLVLPEKEQNKLLKDYETGKIPSQKMLRVAVREMQGKGKEKLEMGVERIIRILENFLHTQNTLTFVQEKRVEAAIKLLKGVLND